MIPKDMNPYGQIQDGLSSGERQLAATLGVAEVYNRRQSAHEAEKIARLRDEFAMAALTGMVAAEYAGHVDQSTWSKDSYLIADAMLKAREIK